MRRATLSLILMSLCASPLVGQMNAGPASVPATPVTFDLPGVREPDQERPGPSLKSRIGRMFTGAVVGGWLGYFASHVAVSDWESDADFMHGRGAWAVGGLVLGAVTGRLAFDGGRSPDELQPTLATARKAIERDEIVSSGAVDAYQMVRSLRKEWLIPRGLNSFRESAQGRADFDVPLQVVPGADHILVYLDNARLGGTQYLEEVATESLARAEWIEPAEATFRWGTGHAHGVILLTTMGANVGR
ncbi:MAG TPA: hypothetical protein VFZ69_06520 [Longimicrobiales bacterium]